MDPDDFESYADEGGGVSALVDCEGVLRIPCIPRKKLVVIQIEVLERLLTETYAQGRAAERANVG